MQNKPGRVILDTNLWISFLITKDYSKLDEIIFSKQW
jgi:predicted nucleic acid-binding protein